MREIKFRAWHEATGVMSYRVGVSIEGKVLFQYPDDDRIFTYDQTTLMQYTGLKDKNGAEIYEGDVVRRQRIGTKTTHIRGEAPLIEKWEGQVKVDVVKWDEYSDGEYVDSVECYMVGSDSLSDEIALMNEISPKHGACLGYQDTYRTYNLIIEVMGNIYENPEILNNSQ